MDSWVPNIFGERRFTGSDVPMRGGAPGSPGPKPQPLNQQTGNDEGLGNRRQYRGTRKFDIIANPGGTRCPAQ